MLAIISYCLNTKIYTVETALKLKNTDWLSASSKYKKKTVPNETRNRVYDIICKPLSLM